MYSRSLNTKTSTRNYKTKGDLLMLNKTMWDIFKKTGNINAYLYLKEYEKYSFNKNNMQIKNAPLQIKEITII